MSVLHPLGQILKMACQDKRSLERGKSNNKKLGLLKQTHSLTGLPVALPHSYAFICHYWHYLNTLIYC